MLNCFGCGAAASAGRRSPQASILSLPALRITPQRSPILTIRPVSLSISPPLPETLEQPIVVTPQKGGYQIVAGERRYRAAKKAGLDKIPALVRTLTDQHKLELSLIENLQRRDLNPLETATAYLKLRDQFNLTLDEIGQRVGGKSVSTISNTLRLLRLPEPVREALLDGRLEYLARKVLFDLFVYLA